MDVKKYIASGILELYVAGTLSEEENAQIHGYAKEYPEIQREIEAIEAAILALGEASYSGTPDFSSLKEHLERPKNPKVISLSGNWAKWKVYSGWAAAAVFAIGFFWSYIENGRLQSKMDFVNQENQVMEQQILEARNAVSDTEKLLNTLRNKDINVVSLDGQEASPNAYAKAYWNKKEQKVFIDALGLPEPPKGMVYQVWSLKLNPLTPTNLGLLKDFSTHENKVFTLLNPNESEAFGITLEPEGGSESPTLERLYTLGAIAS
ncbi:anti-sigma factor [Flavobacteriaceae bacterium 3-367]|uniref:anti-sigma factor n=1 Tax=Eudoraea algarum TaxID=3417568 RepID=UPI003293C349